MQDTHSGDGEMKMLFKFMFSVSAILVILAFIGVGLLAGCKNAIVDNWDMIVDNARTNLSASTDTDREVAAPEIETEPNSDTEDKVRVKDKITGFIDEQIASWEAKSATKEAEEQAKQAEAEAIGVSGEYDFYVEYIARFNDFRKEQGLPSLITNSQLNEMAAKRAIEISQPGNFSHAGIVAYNLGENIAMLAYSSDSPSSLVDQWATSPGHRANMLDWQYRSTGFAKNGRFAVQLFDF